MGRKKHLSPFPRPQAGGSNSVDLYNSRRKRTNSKDRYHTLGVRLSRIDDRRPVQWSIRPKVSSPCARVTGWGNLTEFVSLPKHGGRMPTYNVQPWAALRALFFEFVTSECIPYETLD